MERYIRKYVNLQALHNSTHSKNRFGSAVLEKINGRSKINIKVNNISYGVPHNVYVVHYNEEKQCYQEKKIGILENTKNSGILKAEVDRIFEAIAIVIYVNDNNKKDQTYLVGYTGEKYNFYNNLIRIDEYNHNKYDDNKESINVENEKQKLEEIHRTEATHIEENENQEKKEAEIVYVDIDPLLKNAMTDIVEQHYKDEETNSDNEYIENSKNQVVEEEMNVSEKNKNLEENYTIEENEPIEEECTIQDIDEQTKENQKDDEEKTSEEIYVDAIVNDYETETTDIESKEGLAKEIYDSMQREISELVKLTSGIYDEEIENKVNKDTNPEHPRVQVKKNNIKTFEEILGAYDKVQYIEYNNAYWVEVGFDELEILQKRYWRLFFDPIIISSLRKYDTMLVGEYIENGAKRYIMAIKDRYKNGNLGEAELAGVVGFKSIDGEETISYDTLGYWIVNLI